MALSRFFILYRNLMLNTSDTCLARGQLYCKTKCTDWYQISQDCLPSVVPTHWTSERVGHRSPHGMRLACAGWATHKNFHTPRPGLRERWGTRLLGLSRSEPRSCRRVRWGITVEALRASRSDPRSVSRVSWDGGRRPACPCICQIV